MTTNASDTNDISDSPESDTIPPETTKPGDRVLVEVGSQWRDLDPRSSARIVEVVAVSGYTATIRNVKTGLETKANLAAFTLRPMKKGYGPAVAAAASVGTATPLGTKPPKKPKPAKPEKPKKTSSKAPKPAAQPKEPKTMKTEKTVEKKIAKKPAKAAPKKAPKGDDSNLDQLIQFTDTEENKEAIYEAAKAEDRSASSFIRRIVHKHLGIA